ncbi:MAG TPA: adenylate/guanylate cyclase domain-containing protein [Burkholderiales bacterium]|nr:adenylate/guanylate cyclase domain-containing protein [Burkholderiales bacterium]
MRRPISLKVYSIALGLLVLMALVTGLSARNLRVLNNEVAALSSYYIPVDQQVGSVETLVRQQVVHFERILLLLQAPRRDKAAIEQEKRLFDQRGVNADQVIDSSLRLIEQALASREVDVDRVGLTVLKEELPDIQTARQHFHATFRQFLVEAEEGNPRSLKIVRDVLVQEKEAINGRLEKVIVALQKLTQDSADRARAEEARAVRLNWGITIVAVVLGLIFAAIITRNLVQPVRRLLTGTRAVEQGDLNIRIQASSADEIAALTEAFNNMVAGLREKERIKDTFGKYVDPRIVQGLLENRLSSSGGEKRVMTVSFSDLVGFTAMCEQLTPDGVVRFLNQYFTLMSEPIREHQGIIDKFIGDAIMSYWGPPFTDEREHAALACFSALDQIARMEQFRRMLPDVLGLRRGLPTVNFRIGIASGDVTVGTIGSELSKGFTVIGDNVNLASRLEGANKEYGTTILMNEDTWKLAADAIEARELDSIRVVGKSEPVRIFELLGRKGQLGSGVLELKGHFEQGLRHYRKGEWDAAEKSFRDCLKLDPADQPAKLLLSRVEQLRADPSARQADGVWNLTKK